MANVISQVQRPALVLAHNKTLAAQLYQEFKAFFPENAVEYFVSYYDYYQPEAYIARTDTYIEKDMAINDQIDRMRLCATRSLIERRDVIIVSSVSCIYGLGTPEYYSQMQLILKTNETAAGTTCCSISSKCTTTAAIMNSCVKHSVSVATFWRSCRLMKKIWPTALNFSAMRSNGSASIDPLTGKVSKTERSNLDFSGISPCYS